MMTKQEKIDELMEEVRLACMAWFASGQALNKKDEDARFFEGKAFGHTTSIRSMLEKIVEEQ